jgi:hypothetical protein
MGVGVDRVIVTVTVPGTALIRAVTGLIVDRSVTAQEIAEVDRGYRM